jgi:hypothetical protein
MCKVYSMYSKDSKVKSNLYSVFSLGAEIQAHNCRVEEEESTMQRSKQRVRKK